MVWCGSYSHPRLMQDDIPDRTLLELVRRLFLTLAPALSLHEEWKGN